MFRAFLLVPLERARKSAFFHAKKNLTFQYKKIPYYPVKVFSKSFWRTRYVEEHILRRKHVVGVSLDIQAAFDSIYPHKVKEALLRHGGDKAMVNWYYNYLIHRNLHFDMAGCKRSITTRIGFPQGGVNSADFWKIAFDPALGIINENGVRGNGFADDLLVMRGGYNINAAMKQIQKVIDKLRHWGSNNGLVFNPSKTVVPGPSHKQIHFFL